MNLQHSPKREKVTKICSSSSVGGGDGGDGGDVGVATTSVKRELDYGSSSSSSSSPLLSSWSSLSSSSSSSSSPSLSSPLGGGESTVKTKDHVECEGKRYYCRLNGTSVYLYNTLEDCVNKVNLQHSPKREVTRIPTVSRELFGDESPSSSPPSSPSPLRSPTEYYSFRIIFPEHLNLDPLMLHNIPSIFTKAQLIAKISTYCVVLFNSSSPISLSFTPDPDPNVKEDGGDYVILCRWLERCPEVEEPLYEGGSDGEGREGGDNDDEGDEEEDEDEDQDDEDGKGKGKEKEKRGGGGGRSRGQQGGRAPQGPLFTLYIPFANQQPIQRDYEVNRKGGIVRIKQQEIALSFLRKTLAIYNCSSPDDLAGCFPDGVRYLILIPRSNSLLSQTRERMEALGLEGEKVAHYNNKGTHAKKIKEFKQSCIAKPRKLHVLICDECHWGPTRNGAHDQVSVLFLLR